MTTLPPPVPELPVADLATALTYYQRTLGFHLDWQSDGLAGISRGACRIFLADNHHRATTVPATPVTVWINLESIAAVDALSAEWQQTGASLLGPPESKPWGLHEFTADDADGNRLRIFDDVATSARHRVQPS